MNVNGAFRGSAAVAAGVLSRGVLSGPRYRRLYPDVYVPAELPVDIALRSRAAYLLLEPRGVLAGYSAAELLGASCGPEQGPAEIICSRSRRTLPGLTVHRDTLAADEIAEHSRLRMTTPARTAYDLGRWLDLTETVTAVDALAHRFPFEPADLQMLRNRHLGARGSRALGHVLAMVDRRAESPMESRVRVVLVPDGLSCSAARS